MNYIEARRLVIETLKEVHGPVIAGAYCEEVDMNDPGVGFGIETFTTSNPNCGHCAIGWIAYAVANNEALGACFKPFNGQGNRFETQMSKVFNVTPFIFEDNDDRVEGKYGTAVLSPASHLEWIFKRSDERTGMEAANASDS